MTFSDLLGKAVLLVEDDYEPAREMAITLEHQGCDVVGPYPSLEDALNAVDRVAINAAVLEIRLGTQDVFPLADRLAEKAVPFLFVTGLDRDVLPKRFSSKQCLRKPVQTDEVAIAVALIIAKAAPRH